jgi:hypothetical protein
MESRGITSLVWMIRQHRHPESLPNFIIGGSGGAT